MDERKPIQGKWGLWYVDGIGHATKEQAEAYIRKLKIDENAKRISDSALSAHDDFIKRKQESATIWKLAIGGLLAFLVVYGAIKAAAPPSPAELSAKAEKERIEAEKKARKENGCDDEVGAFVMSQRYVRERLKAPGSAEFPYITDDRVVVKEEEEKDGKCFYIVAAYVDAKNSFGATVRSSYTVVMTKHGSENIWSGKALVMD